MSIMGMGLRIGTMLQQVAGYANSIEVLGSDGEAWMLSGAKSVASMGLRGSFDFTAERSGVVRHRMNQVDRTQEEELATLDVSGWKTSAGAILFPRPEVPAAA
jgi:hypothetical protein